jgi:hypothetical protein
VAGLQGRAHNPNVPRAVEGIVAPAVRHLDQLLHDGLVLEVGRVDEIRRAKLVCPFLLARVDVDDDDLAGLLLHGALDDRQPDAASAEDRHGRALVDLGGLDRGAVTRCDAAAEQAGPVHGRILGDGHDGDVGHDSVLGEGRGAHEVEEVLALALESRGPVRHHALALRGPNLAAEVRLAGLAELALATLGRAVDGVSSRIIEHMYARGGSLLKRHHVVPGLDRRDALANRLDDSRALVAEDDGEGPLGILPRQRVCICSDRSAVNGARIFRPTRVADTRVMDLYPDFVRPWWADFDVFEGQFLACFPSHGGLGRA